MKSAKELELLELVRKLAAAETSSEMDLLRFRTCILDLISSREATVLLAPDLIAEIADPLQAESTNAWKPAVTRTLNAIAEWDTAVSSSRGAAPLPVCTPPPAIKLDGKSFAFTGTFLFGSELYCEMAVVEGGGTVSPLSPYTDFLVIGEYVGADWAKSKSALTIQKAVFFRDAGFDIKIVTEAAWIDALSE
ncbi:hypothetical protein CBW24_07830 [Pacificitalea manganoxidans]|uniref:BRCT domain-containing protein n=1 Tax=Pacificitalea manganoxidans TaxID=1411902 RepID=A0A291LYZ7_9RHOB|nr:hypothetical protein [Pacificitalea manganoxidans]ATI41919.1 hypothetical protein CBW24_07830 [Pacificitalea manganoxidans]MDR6309405.1 NAD-dependent DNA ligase [Pacificitalea manganoxidans]